MANTPLNSGTEQPPTLTTFDHFPHLPRCIKEDIIDLAIDNNPLANLRPYQDTLTTWYLPFISTIRSSYHPTPSYYKPLPGTPTTFHSWPLLPEEVKLNVLDILLVGARKTGISATSHDTHTNSDSTHDLVALLRTSKDTRDLAWRSYYRHGIVLAPEFNNDCFRIMRSPSTTVSPHIRRVELRLRVPNIFGAKKAWSAEPKASTFAGMEELLCLLQPVGHGEHAQYWGKKVAWQRMENVQTLKIVLRVKGVPVCLEGSEAWKGVFWHVGVAARAKGVQVVVEGFRCCEAGTCEWDCKGEVEKAIREFVVGQPERMV
jgi:hypothetical protein